jgi:hypothetical protein
VELDDVGGGEEVLRLYSDSMAAIWILRLTDSSSRADRSALMDLLAKTYALPPATQKERNILATAKIRVENLYPHQHTECPILAYLSRCLLVTFSLIAELF